MENKDTLYYMMKSLNGKIFGVTGSVWGGGGGGGGDSPVTGEVLTQRSVTSFDLRLNEKAFWLNDRYAPDLRCHRVHYDITILT